MENTLGALRAGAKLAKIGMSAALRAKISQQAAEKYLLESLTAIPGLPQKAAQWLDMKFDEPSQIKLDQLTVNEVSSILKDRVPKLYSEIIEIHPDGVSASLGQVNKCTLKNGKELAVKVQYPEIQDNFKTQLSLLKFSLSKSPAVKFGLDIKNYEKDFIGQIESELDYIQEAQSQILFHNTFIDEMDTAIPKVFSGFSTETVLVQEWLPAVQLTQLKNKSVSERLEIGKKVFRNLLVSIFKKGLVHTDFQPGNWGYDEQSQRLVLYDFGSSIQLSAHQRYALICLIQSIEAKNSRGIFDGLIELGFNKENLLQVADQIPHLMEQIFGQPLIGAIVNFMIPKSSQRAK